MDKDFLKEKIAYYKLWITIFTTINAGMIAWIYKNLKTLSVLNFVLVAFIIFLFVCSLLIINEKARIFLSKLEI